MGTAWWAREDSNLQPDRYERSALTIELRARLAAKMPIRLYATPHPRAQPAHPSPYRVHLPSGTGASVVR
jgi:hypothetical protein